MQENMLERQLLLWRIQSKMPIYMEEVKKTKNIVACTEMPIVIISGQHKNQPGQPQGQEDEKGFKMDKIVSQGRT